MEGVTGNKSYNWTSMQNTITGNETALLGYRLAIYRKR